MILKINIVEKINEIKLPKGVESISVKQYDDKIVIEFIPEEAKFKRGDILISTADPDLTVIFDKMTPVGFDSIYNSHLIFNNAWNIKRFRHATKEEKQKFFDELKADGKRWNAEKLIIEDVPQPKFKRGDILISTVNPGLTVIFDKTTSTTTFDSIYHNNLGSRHYWVLKSFRHATKEEEQEFFDELAVKGKWWNAEIKCIEDIPQPKFKAGDKVTLKSGCTSKPNLTYISAFDEYIGKELIVIDYTKSGDVLCNNSFCFSEDWLEFYTEEPKSGDLAIFWDNGYRRPIIRIYDTKRRNKHYDNIGRDWNNAVKWDGNKEQFEKVLRGEI